MEREYTVIANTREDLPALEAEITASSGAGPIPNRSVDIANPRPGSKIQTHFMLTDEEAEELRSDPRVRAVEIPPDQRDDISIGLNASQFGRFFRGSGLNSEYVNWGLRRCVSTTNNYYDFDINSRITEVAGPYEYAIDGTGVDVVIQDSGIDPGHPDWNDYDGVSRLQQIDWYTESGVPGTQSANHYRDLDGHGSHCTSIAAGLSYGWAKGAHIYSQKLAGLETLQGADGTGISITDAFDCIRLWHNAKTNGRPTVVNMSWGYGANVTGDPTSGVYRGTAWTYGVDYTTRSTLQAATGVSQNYFSGGTSHRIPVRVASVDAEVDDMITDGIHVCIAAGNNLHKAESGPVTQTNTFSGEGQFGSDMAQFGAVRVNGNLAVIGETGLDRARVFNLDTGAVVYTLTDPVNGGQYGRAVDITGSWIVVADLNAGISNSGEVYVYNRSTGALTHTLQNPNAFNTPNSDVFGSKVAISGDMIAVSATGEDDADGLSSGKVYVFDLGSATPTTVLHTLDNPNNDGGSTQADNFGDSLAIDGNNLVVGTPADDTGGTNAGIVYVYDLGSVTPTVPSSVIENPNPLTPATDDFGVSAGISGNLIIVGANNTEDAGGVGSGKAYIFNLSDGSLRQTLDNPSASQPSTSDEFGTEVSISGGLCLVGAPLEDVGGSLSGSVYMFDANTGDLLHTFVNPGHPNDTSVAGDRFGGAVSIDGNRIVIGAWGTAINGVNQTGSAYSYTTNPDYYNTVTFSGTSRTYHRGSSPYSNNAFMVGNVDSGFQNSSGTEQEAESQDQTSVSTTRGPGVNIFAPGTNIMAATSRDYDTGSYTITGYPGNPTFPIMSISGTSMASPQVAGVVAQHLQVFPNISPAQMQARIFSDSKAALFTTGSDTDYGRIYDSLMGAPNRMLFSRYGKQAITTNISSILGSITAT